MGLFSLAYLSAPWTTLSQGHRGRYTGSRFPPPLPWYRGYLGYLENMARPDLAFPYSQLRKFVQCPQPSHMALPPNTCCDTTDDRAGDTDTLRSHTDYVLMMNVGPISWQSQRQVSVALSTPEAEYMAASLCGQDIVYIRAILRDFGVSHSEPTLIYEDCQGQSCVHSYVRQAQVAPIAPHRYPEASIPAGLVDIRRTCVWEDPF